MRDITEQKRVDESLREIEEKFQLMFNNVNDAVLVHEIGPHGPGKNIAVNNKMCEMLGYTREELLGMSVIDIEAPQPEEETKKRTTEILGGSGALFEIEVVTKDGKRILLEINDRIFDLNGAPAIISVARDITGRKQAEEKLRAGEAQLSNALRIAGLGHWEYDVANDLFTFSDEFYAIFRTTAEQMGGYTMPSARYAKLFVHPDDMPMVADETRKAVKSTDPNYSRQIEHRIIYADGSAGHIAVCIRIIKDSTGRTIKTVGVNQDITERKRAEAEKEKTLGRLQEINQLMQSLLMPAPLQQKLKHITESVVRIFGADFCRIWLIRPADLCKKGCYHAGVSEGPHVCRSRDNCLHLAVSSGRYTHTDGEIQRRVPYGCYKIGRIASDEDHRFLTNDTQNDLRVHNHEWARDLGLTSFAGYQLRIPGEKTLGVLALFSKETITPAEDAMLDGLGSSVALAIQQAATETALQDSEEKYRNLFEAAPIPIDVVGLDGCILDANPAAVEFIRLSSKEEIVGRHFAEFNAIVPEDMPKYIEMFSNLVIEGNPGCAEVRVIDVEGAERRLETYPSLLKKDGVPFAFQVMCIDVTERKRAENALRESEEKYRTLSESSPNAIFMIDGEGKTQYVNNTAEDYSGHDRDYIIGKDISSLFPEKTAAIMQKNVSHVFREKLRITIPIKYHSKENLTFFQLFYLLSWTASGKLSRFWGWRRTLQN